MSPSLFSFHAHSLFSHILTSYLIVDHISAQSIINSGSCKEDEFTCDDGVCIPVAWQCDYEIDCSNGEDEALDQEGNTCVPCADRGYLCHDDTDRCIPPQWKCDGWTDCAGGDDETYCTPCTDIEFTCDDGQCITMDLLCDGQRDCFDGEDESVDQDGNECLITTQHPPNNTLSPLPTTPSSHHTPFPDGVVIDSSINVIDWKYCPSDIVWLGFVNTFESTSNETRVWWIEPKLRDEGSFYAKWSTGSVSPGASFGIGLHIVEYLGKRISSHSDSNSNVTDDPIFCDVTILVLGMTLYDVVDWFMVHDLIQHFQSKTDGISFVLILLPKDKNQNLEQYMRSFKAKKMNRDYFNYLRISVFTQSNKRSLTFMGFV